MRPPAWTSIPTWKLSIARLGCRPIPPAFEYLKNNITFNGQIDFPVLTLHTKGDGLVVVQNESAYRHVVDEEGEWAKPLRRDFIDRAGHCAFTPAETIAAVEKLLDRLNTGRWHEPTAAELNASAAALGPAFNIFAAPSGAIVATPPAFIDFIPSPYLRPFDLGQGSSVAVGLGDGGWGRRWPRRKFVLAPDPGAIYECFASGFFFRKASGILLIANVRAVV